MKNETTSVTTAADHVAQVLGIALEHAPEAPTVVVHDSGCELSRLLTEAYRTARPRARFLPFESSPPTTLLETFEALEPGSLVVLIQSTSFRLDAFRIRIELFRRGLKVVEHPHLARMTGPEAEVYVDSLAYDPTYYRGVGRRLAQRLNDAALLEVVTPEGARLAYPAGLEPAKLNIGDYADLPNVGGQFPIGEVFTESRDLEAVEGRVRIAFFGDTSFQVNRPPAPITLVVERGRVEGTEDSTPEFDRVLDEIRGTEGQVWIRELGLGLNPAFTPDRTVTDIGTFERMCGVHFSLGAKHATYNKPEIRKRSARFHVDVFAERPGVLVDGAPLFEGGRWIC